MRIEIQGKQLLVSGFKLKIISAILHLNRIILVFQFTRNPVHGIKTLKKLLTLKKALIGNNESKKMALVNGKYRWSLYVPGWPSETWKQFFKGEMNRITPLTGKNNRFNNVFLAITKKCSLQCEHCFEWDSLNHKDTLTIDMIKAMVKKLDHKGISQIQLTGGEPMLRLKEMIEIIQTGSRNIEFWILTSGLNFTRGNAAKLKEAGLTGITVSIDHFDPDAHNRFRGNLKSFQWAQEAVQNAIDKNIVVAVSICATRSFISKANLLSYANMAKDMGVSFIQIIEPKAVGHYEGQDVLISSEQKALIENFYLEMNFNTKFKDYPIIAYSGYHQRRSGCMFSGVRSLYIDTDGNLLSCPFCRKSSGSALHEDFDQKIEDLVSISCSDFKTFNSLLPIAETGSFGKNSVQNPLL